MSGCADLEKNELQLLDEELTRWYDSGESTSAQSIVDKLTARRYGAVPRTIAHPSEEMLSRTHVLHNCRGNEQHLLFVVSVMPLKVVLCS